MGKNKKKQQPSDDLDWGLDFDSMDTGGESLDFSSSEDDLFGSSKKKGLPKLSTGRIVWTVFFGMATTACIVFGTFLLWKMFITYPPQEKVQYEDTGVYCLEKWVTAIRSLDSTGEDSYLHTEIQYANGDESKVSFYKKIVATVSYKANETIAKNIYGNTMINKEDDSEVHINSYIDINEEVTFAYVDWSALEFDSETVTNLMVKDGIRFGDVDYENKLVKVFLNYMNQLPDEEIPLKVIQRAPYMTSNPEYQGRDKEGIALGADCPYYITEKEDEYLDNLLFASDEFVDCLDRFSKVCAKCGGFDGTLEVTDEYRTWKRLEEKNGRRPSQYNYKECIDKEWCGSYYLKNIKSIKAEVGDGSQSNPAGYFTDMVTNVYISQYDNLGNITSWEKYPIRISLVEYGVSQDAIDFFENTDDRNRGIRLDSEVQYCYAKFEITNLHSERLTIPNNMNVCDRNGNMQARTGTLYGIEDSITLDPDESGIITTWQSSTELYKKYLVWGSDFARREEPIYFRILLGDLENEDEFKGVTVNTSRDTTKDFSAGTKKPAVTDSEPPATEPRHD